MSGGGGGIGSMLPTALAIGASIAAPELAPVFLSDAVGTTAAVGLTGAALGGGAAALTGGDVGRGALMGGVGGTLAGSGILGGNASLTGPEAANVGVYDVAPVGTPLQASPNDLAMGFDRPGAEIDPNAWGSEVGTNPANAAKDVNFIPGTNAPGTPIPTAGGWSSLSPLAKTGIIGAGGLGLATLLNQQPGITPQQAAQPVTSGLDYKFDRNTYQPATAPYYGGINPQYGGPPAQRRIGYADGGSVGTVEQMSRENATGGNEMFPQSGLGGLTGMNRFQNATNTPMGTDVIEPTDTVTDPYTGAMKFATGGKTPRTTTASTQRNTNLNLPQAKKHMTAAKTPEGLKAINTAAQGGDYNAQFALNQMQGNPVQGIDAASQVPVQAASGGIMGGSIGSYSDGGQMLKGPGDGMSDSIPARIGKHQPARLADSEFVVPADVVSHLGNGSSDAGAKQLYAMMDRIRKARTGTKKQGKQIKPEKYLPA
jgi:hypothetical protein